MERTTSNLFREFGDSFSWVEDNHNIARCFRSQRHQGVRVYSEGGVALKGVRRWRDGQVEIYVSEAVIRDADSSLQLLVDLDNTEIDLTLVWIQYLNLQNDGSMKKIA